MRDLTKNNAKFAGICLAMLLAGALTAGTSLADQTTGGGSLSVGQNSSTCDYLDLQSAIDAASSGDTIRLSGSGAHYSGNTYSIFSKSLTIRGGYATCSVSEPDGRTTLDADGQGRVFTITLPNSASGSQEVHLENLVVINGSAGGTGGGGLLIEGRPGTMAVTMANVEVRDNTSTGIGGGVGVLINGPRVTGGSAGGLILVMDEDSFITANSAQLYGGGIACINPLEYDLGLSSLIVLDRVSILGNSAMNGGGLYANNCRTIQYFSGGTQELFSPTAGLFFNTASESGGGVYVAGRSDVIVRGGAGTINDVPYGDANAGRVFSNQAANGGGVYVTGSSAFFVATDTIIDNNSADFDGGGLYVTDGSLAEVERFYTSPCQLPQSSGAAVSIPRCSRLRNNSAGRHGGAVFVDGAELEVERTIISGNESDSNGSVVYVRGDSERTGNAIFDDSLVHGNEGNRLFYATTHSDILVRWSTITDNNSPQSVFRAFTNTGAARIRIAGSIIWEDDGNVLTTGGVGDLTAFGECIIGHQGLGQIDANFQIYSTNNPRLIEKDATRPYFPGPVSPAIDFCHDNFYFGRPDLAGSSRGTPHQGSPTLPGPSHGDYDIGAYETDWDELSDSIFSSRFQLKAGDTFTDCSDCPTMVMIPAGTFTQGSPASEPQSDDNERPQREVNVPAFALGQTEVTFEQWDNCVADGGCMHTPDDEDWGRGNRPVINVSWNDAQEYVTWLSNKTGQDYRLPSESEREYATRAGTTGRFNTGDCITADQANFRGTRPAEDCPSGNFREQTLPVNSFAPNSFGLHDTHGNVYEWTQDCWNTNYAGAPTDGSAWMTGDCGSAVLRGGFWASRGFRLRSASRNNWTRGNRGITFGFRVARSVTP